MTAPPYSESRVERHGNVKVDFNLVKSRGFALPITGLKSEIRNNIKIQISNDQNISRSYTIFTGSWHVLNLGFMSFVFISDFLFRASDFQKIK
jgi:hypothetical protein